MARYRVRAAARSDLAEIRAYIMRDNPGRAVTFIEELIQHFARLAATPLMGRAHRPSSA